MSTIDLTTSATQLVKFGDVPSAATRISILNANLLGESGSLLYGTGNRLNTGSIGADNNVYNYAEVKALARPSSTGSEMNYGLTNTKDGKLSWAGIVTDFSGGDGKYLGAEVGKRIDDVLHISDISIDKNAISTIVMGSNAKARGDKEVIIGPSASGFGTGGIAIGSVAIAADNSAIAIGENVTAYNSAIAIGENAFAIENSIQLGHGSNENTKTFQAFDYQLLDANGKIPEGRYKYIYVDTYGSVALGNGAATGAAGAVQIGEGSNDRGNTLQFRDYTLMGTDGKVPFAALPDQLHTDNEKDLDERFAEVNKRLDDLGFKQGNIKWAKSISTSETTLGITHKEDGYDIYKEGNFCYMDTWFRLDVLSGTSLYFEFSGKIGELPSEFYPKKKISSSVCFFRDIGVAVQVEAIGIVIYSNGEIWVDSRFAQDLATPPTPTDAERKKYLHFGWECATNK